jgi:septum formation inhibitor MinC
MFKLDNALLEELGLGSLPADEKNRMLAHIYETLEMRVGMKLAEQMTNDQLDEFEGFIDRNDEAGALKWLETNFPNYKDVVAEQLEKLKGEVRESAPQILEASRAQAALQAQQPAMPQAPQVPQANGQPYAAAPQMPQQPLTPMQQPMPPQPQPGQPYQGPMPPQG